MTPRLAAALRRWLARDTRATKVLGHVSLVLGPLAAALGSAKLIWLAVAGTATKVAVLAGAVTAITGATRYVRWQIITALGHWPAHLSPTPVQPSRRSTMNPKTVATAVVQGVLHPATVAIASLIVLAFGVADTALVTHSVSAADIAQLAAGVSGLAVSGATDALRKHPRVRADLVAAAAAADRAVQAATSFDPQWREQVDAGGQAILALLAKHGVELDEVRALAEAHGVSTSDVLTALAEIGNSKTVKEITSAAAAVTPPAAQAA